MTQREINEVIAEYDYCNIIIGQLMYGIVSAEIWETLEDFLDVRLCDVLEEQFRLDSLVHFCQTGKFLEYERANYNC